MYFKDFPRFLYDFNFGDGVSKTTVVTDITRNVRVRREILANVAIYDEYDIVDGETPEIISEKFYGTSEYHWIIMLANEKYDYLTDFPLPESQLVKHIATAYNPTLTSTDWYWKTIDGVKYVYLKITYGEDIPFQAAYLTAPVMVTITGGVDKVIDWPNQFLGLDEQTQYFYFPYDDHLVGEEGVGTTPLTINTEGRENNPVSFINEAGYVVNPSTDINVTPLTGAEYHRRENDNKRRIKIISPELIEVVLRNYEELLG